MSRSVSMRDVAADAGVSVAAVSRVLNNKLPISEEIKEKVISACEKLNYQLNPSIQDLVRKGRNGSTRNIAFVTVHKSFGDPAYVRALEGITRGINEFNYNLSLAHLVGTETSSYELPPILRDDRIDGILITGVLTPELMDLIKELKKPYVVIGVYNERILKGSDCVCLNINALVSNFVETLKEYGKSRIAYFSEYPDNYFEKQLLNCFRNVLDEYALDCEEQLFYKGSGPFSGAFELLKPVFLKKNLPFDAIICVNFRCAQEISHLIMGRHGLSSPPETCIATIMPNPSQCLSAPAVLCDDVGDKTAYQAIRYLVETLQGQHDENRLKLEIAPDKARYAKAGVSF